MDEFFTKIKNNKRRFWILSLGFLAFEGCFNFPLNLHVPKTSIDYNSFMIFFVTCIIIGIIFAALVEKRGVLKVFSLTLLCTLAGMICRYLIEFGEVSNTVNFTSANILIYLSSVPIMVTAVFWITQRFCK